METCPCMSCVITSILSQGQRMSLHDSLRRCNGLHRHRNVLAILEIWILDPRSRKFHTGRLGTYPLIFVARLARCVSVVMQHLRKVVHRAIKTYNIPVSAIRFGRVLKFDHKTREQRYHSFPTPRIQLFWRYFHQSVNETEAILCDNSKDSATNAPHSHYIRLSETRKPFACPSIDLNETYHHFDQYSESEARI